MRADPVGNLGAGGSEPIGAAGAGCRARSLRRCRAGPGGKAKGARARPAARPARWATATAGEGAERGGGPQRGTVLAGAGPGLGGGDGLRRAAARPAASGAEGAERGEEPPVRREEQGGSGEQLRGLMAWVTAEGGRLGTLSFLSDFVSVMRLS